MPRNGVFGEGYIVTSGMPGCMADDAVHVWTLTEAYQIAGEEKACWLDDTEGRYSVEGDIRRDWRFYVNDRSSEFGYHIWTIGIQDAEEVA